MIKLRTSCQAAPLFHMSSMHRKCIVLIGHLKQFITVFHYKLSASEVTKHIKCEEHGYIPAELKCSTKTEKVCKLIFLRSFHCVARHSCVRPEVTEMQSEVE